jgi:hypothetical protein
VKVLSPTDNQLWWKQWVSKSKGWAEMNSVGEVSGSEIEVVSFGEADKSVVVITNNDPDEQLGQPASRQFAMRSLSLRETVRLDARVSIVIDADPVASGQNRWWFDSDLSPARPFGSFLRKFGPDKIFYGFPAPGKPFRSEATQVVADVIRAEKPAQIIALDNAMIASGEAAWYLNVPNIDLCTRLYADAEAAGMSLSEGMSEAAERVLGFPAVSLMPRTLGGSLRSGVGLHQFAEGLADVHTPIVLQTEMSLFRPTKLPDSAINYGVTFDTATRSDVLEAGKRRIEQMWAPVENGWTGLPVSTQASYLLQARLEGCTGAGDQVGLDARASWADASYGLVSNPYYELLQVSMVARELDRVTAGGRPDLLAHVDEQAGALIDVGGIKRTNLDRAVTQMTTNMFHTIGVALPSLELEPQSWVPYEP